MSRKPVVPTIGRLSFVDLKTNFLVTIGRISDAKRVLLCVCKSCLFRRTACPQVFFAGSAVMISW